MISGYSSPQKMLQSIVIVFLFGIDRYPSPSRDVQKTSPGAWVSRTRDVLTPALPKAETPHSSELSLTTPRGNVGEIWRDWRVFFAFFSRTWKTFWGNDQLEEHHLLTLKSHHLRFGSYSKASSMVWDVIWIHHHPGIEWDWILRTDVSGKCLEDQLRMEGICGFW